MDAAAQQSAAPAGPNLTIDKFIEGPITCLRLHGTIDESFDGKRLASSVKAQTLILDMGAVRRISSFGIREWTDFIRAVERSVDQIIAIECTPKLVDQLNMVASFLGSKGQVFSFYAPYRCDYCDQDRRILFQVDRDQAAIRGMRPPEQLCETCSRPSYFDEEPASFFSYLARQPPFELAPEIGEFLSSKLKYSVTGGDRRLHVDKQVDGRNTYLKLVGNLDGSFPSSKIAEGLEGSIVVDVSGVGTIDLAGAAEWRNFITQAKSAAEKIYLVGCPPVLLERLTRQGDLGDQVISFTMPYSCSKCATTASQTIDVEQHYDILKFATPPEMKCSHCKSPTVCVAPESLLSRLRTLPRVEIDAPLRKFIREMRERKPEKPQKQKAQQAPGGRLGWISALLAVAVLGAGALIGVNWYQQRKTQTKLEKALDRVATEPAAATVTRPPWITADTPMSAYCVDNINRLSCVGVSSFNKSKEDARVEAVNAALDEVVNVIGVKIQDALAEPVKRRFVEARSRMLKEFEATRATPESPEHGKALDGVRAARRAVAESLAATGGAAAPAQQAAWFWEEYAAQDGKGGTEFLVFVRYDVGGEALKALMDDYSRTVDVLGGKVSTVFPALAWDQPEVKQGVAVVARLEEVDLPVGSIVTEVNGEPVRDASEFVARVKDKSAKQLKFTVLAAGAAPAP